MYVVLNPDRPSPTFTDTDDRSVTLDLSAYASNAKDEADSPYAPRHLIGVGLEGNFGNVGKAQLVLSLAATDTNIASSWDLPITSLDPQFAPSRRPTHAERQGDRGEAMLALLGVDSLVGTLLFERHAETAWRVDTFLGWISFLADTTDEPVGLSNVDGVRKIPISQIAGNGIRWSRVRDHILAGYRITAAVSNAGVEYDFDIDPYDASTTGGFDRLQFSLPNTGEDAFRKACALVESPCTQGAAWQGHVGRYTSESHIRLRRIYETALGHNRLEMKPDARSYLAEPTRMVIIESALIEELDPDLVNDIYAIRSDGDLVSLVAPEWLDLHTMERALGPILRPSKQVDAPSDGLSRSYRWERPDPR